MPYIRSDKFTSLSFRALLIKWLERLIFMLAGCILTTQLHPVWHPEEDYHLQESNHLNLEIPDSKPIVKSALPHFDLVLAILIKGDDASELDRVDRIYSRYNGTVKSSVGTWSVKTVLVLADDAAPLNGIMDGSFYRVNVPSGYDKISHKTLAAMSLRNHFSFNFMAKADSDTFPCLQRLMEVLHQHNALTEYRIYAGLLNRCGKIFPEGHKLHDAPFIEATGGELQCHPMYHQGGFYVLGRALVEYLDQSRDDLRLMQNEDAMIGLWLLGVQKVLVDIGGDFYCSCFTQPRHNGKDLPFYHFCKTEEKVAGCLRKFQMC